MYEIKDHDYIEKYEDSKSKFSKKKLFRLLSLLSYALCFLVIVNFAAQFIDNKPIIINLLSSVLFRILPVSFDDKPLLMSVYLVIFGLTFSTISGLIEE